MARGSTVGGQQSQNTTLNAKARVRGNDVHVIRFYGKVVCDLGDGHRGGTSKKLCQGTFMLRIEMLHQHETESGVDWQVIEQ